MNTPIVGRIYHVVDKTTGEVVKVGSTIQTLERRRNSSGYGEKYANCHLVDFKVIRSDENDTYDPDDPFCPFLWHLIASEHIEMLRSNTFRTGPLSNKQSPLDQKFFGFDGSVSGVIGGSIGGRQAVVNGTAFGGLSSEQQSERGKKAGLKNAESGHMGRIRAMRNPEKLKKVAKENLAKISHVDLVASGKRLGDRMAASGHCALIAPLGGRRAAESGQLASARTIDGSRKGAATVHARKDENGKSIHGVKNGRKGGKKNAESGHCARIAGLGGHTTWHVNRGIVSPTCKLCQATQ